MIYKLCNGDIAKRRWIEENCDVIDFFELMSLQKYDNYIEAEMSRRLNGKGKTMDNRPKDFGR